jgi:CheY-like chemotaxis protein
MERDDEETWMPPTVLVVDDDDAIRETLVWLLDEEGYPVAEARDGHHALDVLRSRPGPCVVLLDFQMPRLNGYGVLAAVATEPALAAGRAYILCTAQGRTLPLSFVKLLTDLGVNVLPKPFDVQDVLDAVAAAAARLPRA